MNSPKNWNRTKLKISFWSVCVVVWVTIGLFALKRGVKNRDARIRQEAQWVGLLNPENALFNIEFVENLARENAALKKRVDELESGKWRVDASTTNYTITQNDLRNAVESVYPPPKAVTVSGPRYHVFSVDQKSPMPLSFFTP